MCYGRDAWRHQKYNMCNVVENTSIVKPCVNGTAMQTHEILPEKTMFFMYFLPIQKNLALNNPEKGNYLPLKC